MNLLYLNLRLMRTVAVLLVAVSMLLLITPREAYAVDFLQAIAQQIPGLEDYVVGMDTKQQRLILHNTKTNKNLEYDLSEAKTRGKVDVYEEGELKGIFMVDRAARKIKYFNAYGELLYQAELPKTGCDTTAEIKDADGKELLMLGLHKPEISIKSLQGSDLKVLNVEKQAFTTTDYFKKHVALKSKGVSYDPSIDFLLNPPSVDFLWFFYFLAALIAAGASGEDNAVDVALEMADLLTDAVENASNGSTGGSPIGNGCNAVPANSGVNIKTAELIEDFNLPSTSTLSPLKTLTFNHHSAWATPFSFIRLETNTDEFGVCGLDKISWKLNIQGQEKLVFYHGVSGKTYQQYYWDGKNGEGNLLPTGSYPYTVEIVNYFENGLVAPQKLMGRATLINTQNSPFGMGWGIAGIPQLYFNQDGTVLYVDPSGEFATYTPDATGEFVSVPGDCCTFDRDTGTGGYIRTTKDKTQYKFNAQGELQSITDLNGNVTTFEYLNGKLRKITDPSGLQTNFTYDANGYLDYLTDFSGTVINFTNNEYGQLEQVTYPDNSTVSFSYDGAILTSKTDAKGQTTSVSYQPINGVSGYSGLVQSVTFPDGGEKSFKPEVLVGLVNNLQTGTGTAQNPAESTRPEDVKSQVITPEGAKIVKLDKLGNTIEEIDPLGRKTETVRDEKGNPTKIVNPNGQVISNTYDANGNLTTQTDEASGATTTFVYGSPLKEISDPMGHKTYFDYDAVGNLVTIREGDRKTELTYTLDGLISSAKPPKGVATSFIYDASGNTTQITDPMGNITKYQYDSKGNVTQVTDAEGHNTTFNYKFGYNGLVVLTSIRDALGNNTSYTYDDGGFLLTIRDAKNQATSIDYMGRAQGGTTVFITLPNGAYSVFEDDVAGNLVKSIDPKGQVIAYEYDAANRLIKKILPDDTVFYSYDSANNLTHIEDNDSSIDFVYHLSGNLKEAKTRCKGDPTHCQPEVTVFSGANTDELSTGYGTSLNVGGASYGYSAYHELVSVQSKEDKWTYSVPSTGISNGLPTVLSYPNGVGAYYSYNNNGWVTGISYKKPNGTPITSFGYSYDKVGNRTYMTTIEGTHNYTYDAIYRLKSATHPQGLNPTESYTYDSAGNRISSHLSSSYTYFAGNLLLSDDALDYRYDSNGNLLFTRKKGTLETVAQYFYDTEDRLVRVENLVNAMTVTYGYDGLGRRIWKDVDGIVTKYVYNNEDIILEYEGDTLVANYIHGPGIDEPLMMWRNGQKYFYVVDGLGSVTDLVDVNGNVVNHYAYDSFGRIVQKTEGVKNFYTYTGREYDEESGLYYYRARYYDAKVGRFIQKDPLIPRVEPELINLYVYARNNPQHYIDPSGTIPSDVVKLLGLDGFAAKLIKDSELRNFVNVEESKWFAYQLLTESTIKDIYGILSEPEATRNAKLERLLLKRMPAIYEEAINSGKKLDKAVAMRIRNYLKRQTGVDIKKEKKKECP